MRVLDDILTACTYGTAGMAESRRNAPPCGGPTTARRTEEAYQRIFALKRLPWDLINIIIFLACCILHAQLVLEGVALGCDGSWKGPGWFQGATVSRWLRSSSPSEVASVLIDVMHSSEGLGDLSGNCSLQQQCAASGVAYPCNAPWPSRLLFAMLNWRQLAAAVTSNAVAWQILWSHALVPTAVPAAFVLVFALGSACVQRNKRRQHLRAMADGSSSSQAFDAAMQPVQQQAEWVPQWWPALRHGASLVAPALTSSLAAAMLLDTPLPPELLRWSMAFPCSSAARSLFAEVTAISTTVTMVSRVLPGWLSTALLAL